jgi:dienelactone hydrolase
MRSSTRKYTLAGMLALFATAVIAEGAGVDIGLEPVGVIGTPGGSGPWPAVAASDASMRENTLYYPAAWPGQPMPILIWGTGGCSDNGLGYSGFLKEIASHGYFVISGGHPRYERTQRDQSTQLTEEQREALEALPDTNVDQLRAAIDWVEEQSADPESPYHGHMDTGRIAAMGHSCGGLQAIALATDPRVDTSIAFNSGVLSKVPEGYDENLNLVVEKAVLPALKGPIAYINGGPDDIAYENGLDDFNRLTHIPVFFAENGVGHGGTFWADANGGEYASVAIKWMEWHLNDNEEAAAWFVGNDCRLCNADGWKVRKKRIED